MNSFVTGQSTSRRRTPAHAHWELEQRTKASDLGEATEIGTGDTTKNKSNEIGKSVRNELTPAPALGIFRQAHQRLKEGATANRARSIKSESRKHCT
jgi:hypothetical protein